MLLRVVGSGKSLDLGPARRGREARTGTPSWPEWLRRKA